MSPTVVLFFVPFVAFLGRCDVFFLPSFPKILLASYYQLISIQSVDPEVSKIVIGKHNWRYPNSEMSRSEGFQIVGIIGHWS
jgi:hypothetical protein